MAQYVGLIKAPEDNQDPFLVPSCEKFLQQVSEAFGEELVFSADPDVLEAQEFKLFLIGSGGSEQEFRRLIEKVSGPYYLLTTRTHNSLAASMEILSFLRERGEHGEIIHGEFSEIAERLRVLSRVVRTRKRLQGLRLGMTGESDWLIGQSVDGDRLRERTGMEVVHVPMSEIMSEWEKRTYEENEWTEELKAKGYRHDDLERALQVYGAVKRVVQNHDLDAITLKCFDLLEPTCISGCIALAVLNAEGIHAGCEGDSRSLVSMTVLGELTGQPVFMANPSRLYPSRSEIVFAHCVLPLNMAPRYGLTTHFESGLGVAVAADFDPGDCCVFKCNGDLSQYYAADAQLAESLHEGHLCRTQIVVKIPSGLDYFTKRPIANHQMIVLGHHAEMIEEFFRLYDGENLR